MLKASAIPAELRARDQFVVWKKVARQGKKPTKRPYNPITREPASSMDRRDWGSFDDAFDAYLAGGFDGIGYVFAPDDPFVGVDLDDCVSGGQINGDALRAIESLDGYTEYSPSGNGIHIIVKAELPGRGRCDTRAGREVYDRGRFFTLTGDRIESPSGGRIQDRQGVVEQIYREWFPRASADGINRPYTFDDDAEILAVDNIPGLSDETISLIQAGEGMDRFDGDHSVAIWYAALEMMRAGANDETVLSVLSDPENYLAENGALAPHRRDGDIDSGRRWLWDYVVCPQRAAHELEREAFEDLEAFPEEPPDYDRRARDRDRIQDDPEDDRPRGALSDARTFGSDFSPSRIPPRDWVLGTRFLRGAVTAGFGSPGTGKSAFTIATAIAVVTGRPITGEAIIQQTNAMIINGEEPVDELERRVAAVLIEYDIPKEEVDGKLWVYSGYSSPKLILARRLPGPGGGTIVKTRGARDLVDFCKEREIGFLSLDPFVGLSVGLEENSNSDVEALMTIIRDIADETGAAVDLVHHTNKSAATGPAAASATSGRGASALSGAARVIYTLVTVDAKEAEDLALTDDERGDYFRMYGAKANYSRKSGAPIWFRHSSVSLGNGAGDDFIGDSVGVPVVVDFQDLKARAEQRRSQGEPDALSVLREAVAVMVEDEITSIGLRKLASAIRKRGSVPMVVLEISATLEDILDAPRVVQLDDEDYRIEADTATRTGIRVICTKLENADENFRRAKA